MLSLLGFEDAFDVLPFVIIPIAFVVIFTIVIVAVVRRAQAEQRQKEINASQAQFQFLDGNGHTEHQRNYLNSKRNELAERKITANDDSHSHSGKVENYGKIVGSLGEVNDEGCDELDGIRLIEHDEAYCDDPDHLIPADTADLQKAIVIGEVLNAPRFKQPYRRK